MRWTRESHQIQKPKPGCARSQPPLTHRTQLGGRLNLWWTGSEAGSPRSASLWPWETLTTPFQTSRSALKRSSLPMMPQREKPMFGPASLSHFWASSQAQLSGLNARIGINWGAESLPPHGQPRVRDLGVDVLISCRQRRDHLLIVGLRLNLLLAIFVPRRVLALGNPFAAALSAGVSLRKLSNSSLLCRAGACGASTTVTISRSWLILFRSKGILAPRVWPQRASPTRQWYQPNLIRGSLLSALCRSASTQAAAVCSLAPACTKRRNDHVLTYHAFLPCD